jgi:hypothetical protein
MKITKTRLKEIIKEEVSRHNRRPTSTLSEDPSDETFAMFDKVVAAYGGDYQHAGEAVVQMLPQDIARDTLSAILNLLRENHSTEE